MKRSLLYLLVVIVAAGVIGTLAAKDPGYVLISYNGASLQTGLWVFLGAIALLSSLIWVTVRILRGVVGTAARVQSWRIDRRRGKSIEHTHKGLLFLQEGNADRAKKFLTSGIKHQPQPVVNYLNLAKAANDAGEDSEREKYLRLAEEADPQAALAIAIARAELALGRDDSEACLLALANATENKRSLMLKKEALLTLGRWSDLEKLMPKLKKTLSNDAYEKLEKDLVLAVLGSEHSSADKRLALFKGASDSVKQDADVLQSLSLHVGYEKEVEPILRRALKKSWHPKLVEVYGKLGAETAQKRLKTSLAWRKQYPKDASLDYCVGLLHEVLGQKAEAKEAYEAAIEHGRHGGASRQLANLYAFDGNHEKSNEYLLMALES